MRYWENSDLYRIFRTVATHSSVLAWRIPGTGKPGGLPSMGSHRVRHNWSDLAVAAHLWAKLLQLCPTLWDPMDCSPPASPVYEFSRQEYWIGLLRPPPGDHPDPEIKLSSLTSPALAGGFFLSLSHQGSPSCWLSILNIVVVSWLLYVISSFPCCLFSLSSSNYWNLPSSLALRLSYGFFPIFPLELSWVCRGCCDGGGVVFMLFYFLVYFLKFIS